MKFNKRKVLGVTVAGVILVGTMSTIVMAGGKDDYSRLWCRETVCSQHGADCQNREDCVSGSNCRNQENCVNSFTGQSQGSGIDNTGDLNSGCCKGSCQPK